MKEIRALVADDELPARGELTYELSNIPGVKDLLLFHSNYRLSFSHDCPNYHRIYS